MTQVRTFVAIEATAVVRARAGELIALLRESGAGMRWVRPDAMHLTLKFLGDVEEGDLGDLCQAVVSAVARHSQFEVSFVGAGAFPRTVRPRTVWLGVRDGYDAVCALQASIESSLEEIGIEREGRRFSPHLTLGRAKHDASNRRLSDLIARSAEFDAGRMLVEEVVVFSSELRSDGPVHTPLAHAPLSV